MDNHMKLRLFLSVQPMQEVCSEKNSHRTQAGKQNRKRSAYLSKELKGLIGVIPYLPLHPLVHQYSRNKFSRCHKYSTPKYLSPERLSPFRPDALYNKKQHAKASQYKHRPMRKSPKHHFYAVINAAAKRPEK